MNSSGSYRRNWRKPRSAEKKEIQQVDAAAGTLIAETLKILSDAEAGTSDLAGAEMRIRDVALSYAAKMVGTIMSGPLQRATGVDAPTDRREQRTRSILSAVGEVSYTRWYAVDPKGKRSFPADEALGIICGCTPGAAKRLCHMGAKSQSYSEASQSLELLSGIRASQNTIQRLVGTVGPDMADWAHRRTPATLQPGRDIAVCLQMDMTGVRLLKKYLNNVKGKNWPPKRETDQMRCRVPSGAW